MSSIAVKEIVSTKFVTLNEDDSLSNAVSIYKEKKPAILVILNSKRKYKGILAERWIARSKLNPDETKVKNLTRSAPRLALNSSLSFSAKQMIENDLMQLPVFDKGKIVGIVTEEAIIHRITFEKFGDKKVKDIMIKDPFVVEEDITIGNIINIFREQGFSRAPVVKNSKLVGIITVHDIVDKIIQPKGRYRASITIGKKVPILSIPVKSVMSSPVITVVSSTTLREADNIMHNKNISSLVVTDNEKLVGMVTKRDFLEPIAQLEKTEVEHLTIQTILKGSNLTKDEQNVIIQNFDTFAHKYDTMLKGGTLFVYMKQLGSKFRGSPLIHFRLQLRSIREIFVSVSEGWGVENTFHLALDRLERQILKIKELENESTFASKFLDMENF